MFYENLCCVTNIKWCPGDFFKIFFFSKISQVGIWCLQKKKKSDKCYNQHMDNMFLEGQREQKKICLCRGRTGKILQRRWCLSVSWRININLPGREEEKNVSGRWNWLLKGHRSSWLGNGKPRTITEANEILKIFNKQQGMNADQSELTIILPMHTSWISAPKQSQCMCLA